MQKEEVEQLFGIELRDHGQVFDPVENKNFKTLEEWATFYVENDSEPAGFEDMHQHGYFDDDY